MKGCLIMTGRTEQVRVMTSWARMWCPGVPAAAGLAAGRRRQRHPARWRRRRGYQAWL